MESDNENEKFIALIEEYKIILDKSQSPATKEMKQAALTELIVKWAAVSGKTLSQKSILKKLSNLKVLTKAVEAKKQPLCSWQTRLLSITKDIEDDEPLLSPGTAETVPGKDGTNVKATTGTTTESVHLETNYIVDGYETSETRKLSNNQLKRIILLEQLKIVQLKRMKMEKKSQIAAVSGGSANEVEIEYIGFGDVTNIAEI